MYILGNKQLITKRLQQQQQHRSSGAALAAQALFLLD
jgi:hypothetical protein